MLLTYPDAKRAIRELLNAYGKTYLRLTADYQERGLPAFLVYRVGGSQADPFREDRITVETYALGATAADEAADEIHDFLTYGPHATSLGLLDAVLTETLPAEIPQPDDFPNLVSATYRVQTRGLRA